MWWNKRYWKSGNPTLESFTALRLPTHLKMLWSPVSLRALIENFSRVISEQELSNLILSLERGSAVKVSDCASKENTQKLDTIDRQKRNISELIKNFSYFGLATSLRLKPKGYRRKISAKIVSSSCCVCCLNYICWSVYYLSRPMLPLDLARSALRQFPFIINIYCETSTMYPCIFL